MDTTLERLLGASARQALRPTRSVRGRLRTDRHNRLVYELSSTPEIDGHPGPHTGLVEGTWRLTPNHELALDVRHAARTGRRTLSLRGAVVAARAHALVFALRRGEGERRSALEHVTLSGRWQADARNRLTFLVSKADGAEDRLTFQGAWDVGPRHEVIYRYRQRVGRRREEHTLRLTGAWDVTRAGRLVFRVAGSNDSSLEFRVSVRSPSVIAREGRLVYEVGIGLSRGRLERRRVALFGTWKLHRDLSVAFEVPYANGRVGTIRFEGTYALNPRNRVAAALENGRGEPLGITVLFTREITRDASLFLRLKRTAEEASAIGGVQVRF